VGFGSLGDKLPTFDIALDGNGTQNLISIFSPDDKELVMDIYDMRS